MHIITRKRIVDFANDHPNCASGLESWYGILKHSTISNFIELQEIFPSADKVDGLTVFNIGGNKVRLIAAIHYNIQRFYIRYVLTHSEYDKTNGRRAENATTITKYR